MTDAPSPRPAGKARSFPLALAALLLLLLGFTVTSSLAAAVSENRWWLLGCGLVVCVVLPALVASWVRSLRKGGGPGRPRPTAVSAIAVTNALVVLGGGLLAPATTAERLRRHGAWWVESIAGLVGKKKDSPVVSGAERTMGWLAGLLPGAGDAGVPDASQGASREAGPVAADSVEGAPDRGEETAVPDRGVGVVELPGEVRVRFQRRGAAVVIPVTLHGPPGSVEVQMLFDTGASITTLDGATLRRLGVLVSPGDPTIETHTANGTARRIITTIDGVTLGGARIDRPVTVAHCEPCAKDEIVGLLGLNVLRRFAVTLDDEAGQVVLRPRRTGHPQGELADIRPFIELQNPRGVWRGPLLTVTARLENRAPRGVRHLKLAAVVSDGAREGRVWGEVRDVPARGTVEVKLEGLSPVKGARFELRVEQASW